MTGLKIPKEVTLPVFVTVSAADWNYNDVHLHPSDPRKWSDSPEEYVMLLETEVTLTIPQGVDVRGQLLVSLEKTKTKVLAENHANLKCVQDKIDSLLAIEHQELPDD